MPRGITSFVDDEIMIDGVSINEIAEKFGTPTYVYSERKIKENYLKLVSAFDKTNLDVQLFYAIKACNNPHIARILTDLGAGIDAASPNEIELAKLVKAQKIIFTGNNLSDEDIAHGLNNSVVFNVDDWSILDRIFEKKVPNLLSFRINPGENSVHRPYQDFAGAQAKFGVPEDDVLTAYQYAKNAGVKKFGFHMMPSSCCLNVDSFKYNTRSLLEIIVPVIKKLNLEVEFIDLGGGLGIPYRDSENALDVAKVARVIEKEFQKYPDLLPLDKIQIIMEPARYFVGDAGVLIGRVHSIKKRETTPIIGTDVSMNVLARPALYGDHGYHRIHFNEKEQDSKREAGLCGQVCENTDFWITERKFPMTVDVGDLFAVYDVGAYGFSMSYHYNGRLRPAEVLITECGEVRQIRRREEFQDMLSTIEFS